MLCGLLAGQLEVNKDMHFSILTNNHRKNMKSIFEEMENSYDSILIATAFFSETETILKMINKNINIVLLVSLRSPTDPHALEKIYVHQNVDVKFLPADFHSKFYIFLKDNIPIAGIIGSSNFTNGGLENNIETNIFSKDIDFCKALKIHFQNILEKAHDLEPNDISKYKRIFALQQKLTQSREEKIFYENLLKDRRNTNKNISRKAKEYLSFIRIVSDVKRIVEDELRYSYPDIPAFLVIDHFWHWLKTEYANQNPKFTTPNEEKIQLLFKDYATWEKKENYTKQMFGKAKNIFNKYLDREYLQELTEENVAEIYSNLHSGGARDNRFHSAEKFVKHNDLEKIKKAFQYLLYSKDDIVLRIDRLINPDSELKLEEFGASCTQELLGWVFYKDYPMRNEKADFCVKYLGYKINDT